MNPHARAVLVPPRPNLGPEALPERPGITGGLLVAGLLFGICALLWGWRRRASKRARRPESATSLVPISESSQDQMIAWSEAVREALVSRFGVGWRAKTTEEIAGEGLDSLGPGRGEELVRLLQAADRVKFAPPGDAPATDQSDHWESWVSAFVAEAAAGASSTIKGK